MKISAVSTLPKSKVTLGTDVSGEFPFSRVTTVGALIVIFFAFHSLYLIFLHSVVNSIMDGNNIFQRFFTGNSFLNEDHKL